MSTMLDIVGSFIIGGIVLLSLLTLNARYATSSREKSVDLIVQQNTKVLSDIVEYDFRKIGFRVSSGAKITKADSVNLTFRADIDNNGTVDSVKYYIGTASGTPNPNDKYLYRVVNTESPSSAALGLVQLKLTYYDSTGTVTTYLNKIRAIKVAMTVQSVYPYSSSSYSSAYWELFIRPKNL